MQVPFLDLKVQYRQSEAELKPVLEEISPDHFVACHRAKELQLQGV